jgi:hypothetical protein
MGNGPWAKCFLLFFGEDIWDKIFLHIIGGSISYAFVITTSFCKLFMRIDTKENISQIPYKEDVDQIVYYFGNV